MIAGKVSFVNSSRPSTFTFPTTVTFSNVPVVTVTSVDSLSNNQANVNAFVTTITTTSVSISVSQNFTGDVHFIIVSQD
jgi:hypothetical protein